jgi:dipeptidyl aminopeptidase/acylaminoacyl peptidase
LGGEPPAIPRRVLLSAGLLLGSGCSLTMPPAASAMLISRRVLLAPADREQPQVSPDGQWLAWIAPLAGSRNIWLAPSDAPGNARPLTQFKGRGVSLTAALHWSAGSTALIFGQDDGGDENYRLTALHRADGRLQPLSPAGSRAAVVQLSPRFPDLALISCNDRDSRFFDALRVDIHSGSAERVLVNDGFVNFWADEGLTVRLGVRRGTDGGHAYQQRRTADADWIPAGTVTFEDMQTTGPLRFSTDGGTVYWRDSRGRNTAALTAVSADGVSSLLAEDPEADIDAVQFDALTGTPVGWRSNRERPRWRALTPDFQRDLKRLSRLDSGDLGFLNQSADGSRRLIWFNHDSGPADFRLEDRRTGQCRQLFRSHNRLDGLPLVPMAPATLRSRDGLSLVSYLSRPPDAGRRATPLVLLVHGGPWSRDSWGLSAPHQLLANRGYAVLSVNFRASTGFGKAFINASNGQWGAAMQDDLLDAVDWAVRRGIADPQRVAIMGSSYGGYAALAALTMTPDRFACGIAAAAIANLQTFLETAPPYWKPNAAVWHRRFGADPATEEGRAFLRGRSPLSYLGNLSRPLLLGHGANDPRVKQSEAEAVVAAATRLGLPVVYALFPDEGHGFVRPPNRLAWWALVEQFLALHLGGRVEPAGDDREGSRLQIRSGLSLLPPGWATSGGV